jgi:putative ABC transport system substrate-binding protein
VRTTRLKTACRMALPANAMLAGAPARSRRNTLVALAALLVSPSPGFAQPPTRAPRKRVAICTTFVADPTASADARQKRWSQAFARHGMLADDVEITLVTPGSDDFVANAADWTEVARQVVASRPDLILVHSVWVHIFAPLTRDIPIVFMGTIDPEHHKYIASARRPGGNVTGALDPFFEVQEKRIALLSELRPAARRIALVWHSGGPYGERIEGAFKATAQRLGLEPCVVGLSQDSPDVIRALRECRAEMADFLWTCAIGPGLFVELANLGIASSFACGIGAVRSGGLLCYLAIDALPIALDITSRILRGASVAANPAVQAREFRLALNLRTAKALGIAIPQAIRMQANDLVE